MARLGELAKLIRSKNAGPFMLTFDVMFEDENAYRKVLASGVLDPGELRWALQDAARRGAVLPSTTRPAPSRSRSRVLTFKATSRTATRMAASSTRLSSISWCRTEPVAVRTRPEVRREGHHRVASPLSSVWYYVHSQCEREERADGGSCTLSSSGPDPAAGNGACRLHCGSVPRSNPAPGSRTDEAPNP